MIVANFKMNKTITEINEYMKALKNSKTTFSDVVICPSFVALKTAASIHIKGVEIAAQNISQFENGSYTGEISAEMVKDAGATYAIVGHSERRNLYNETNDIVAAKVAAALNIGLIPIICVGESSIVKKQNKTNEYIYLALESVFCKIKNFVNKKYVIAYEPYWAIGSGKTPSNAEINDVCSFISKSIKKLDPQNTNKIEILYGGSVNEKNAKDILKIQSVDGVLVGSASLNVDKFMQIVEVYNESK